MPAPYPKALRDRIIETYHNGEGSFRELGERFMVGEATVNRFVSLERRTGTTEPKAMGGARRERTVTPLGEEWLRELIRKEPSLSLPQMCEQYESEFGVAVKPRHMGKTLRHLGITKKKRFDGPNRPSAPMWFCDARSG